MVTRIKKERQEQRDKLLYLQDDRCFICRRKYQKKYMTLDHDHALEREGFGFHARGVLCTRCNRALGRFEWTDSTIECAIIYLQRIQALRKEVRNNAREQ
jgi:hypothetical protein